MPRQIRRTKTDSALMLLIPAGEFFRGTDNPDAIGGDPDEAPMRQIFLNSFYIDQFEVTNSQYAIFLQATKTSPSPISLLLKMPLTPFLSPMPLRLCRK